MQEIGKTQQQYQRITRFLRARHTGGKKTKLLEIGAADMILKRWLPDSITYHGLDFGAKNNPSLNHSNKYTYLFDLDKGKMPIKDKTYDYIVCFETLEHVMYPDRVLDEINRVAKKDAIIFLSLPNEYNFIQRIYFLFGIKTYCYEPFMVVEKHLHIHNPRVSDILDLFGKHLKILKVEYIWQTTLLPGWIDKIINLFGQVFPSLFARMVVVTARRKD